MKILFSLAILAIVLNLGEAYSKYGRTCKDIGCLSSEVCVMAETPCSFYTREDECGQYPTCAKSASNGGAPSCASYVCPPTKICRLDRNTPKCVDDDLSTNSKPYNHAANPPPPEQPGLYPQIPHGQTTTRSPIHRPGGTYNGGGGYQGGQIGSGYPGQPAQAPQGYPGQSGYPGHNGYPAQGGYPGSNGYPAQGGYPSGNGYQNPSNNYPYGNNQPGSPYGTSNNNRYGNSHSGSSSDGFVGKLTDSLKALGLFCFINVYYIARINRL